MVCIIAAATYGLFTALVTFDVVVMLIPTMCVCFTVFYFAAGGSLPFKYHE